MNLTNKMACSNMTFGRNTNLGSKFGIFSSVLSCGLFGLDFFLDLSVALISQCKEI
jgi:hypothetical protein